MSQFIKVLVIFLDDAKKQPRWTRSDQKFYRIPSQFSFNRYPAYTYHIWLTDKDNEWSNYGSNPIPLEKRNQIREFIGKYKTYDSTVPDVNCTGMLIIYRVIWRIIIFSEIKIVTWKA